MTSNLSKKSKFSIFCNFAELFQQRSYINLKEWKVQKLSAVKLVIHYVFFQKNLGRTLKVGKSF